MLRQSGAVLWNVGGLVGEAHANAGDLSGALAHLDEALKVSAQTGEVWLDAELHRLKGEILLRMPEPDEAEAAENFVRALEIARAQSARLWELRTAISLSRLWARQGRAAEAGEILEGVRSWFAAGGSSPDMPDILSLRGA